MCGLASWVRRTWDTRHSAPDNDILKFRVTRTEATAIALQVELLKREGKPIPKWMRQIAAAV
jgi:hypothetical protein